MDSKIEQYIIDIIFATRDPESYNLENIKDYINSGASPRASIFLSLAAKSYAFLKKRAAAQNPWGEGATTLEWTVPSPPNFHTFDELPKFEDDQEVQKS